MNKVVGLTVLVSILAMLFTQRYASSQTPQSFTAQPLPKAGRWQMFYSPTGMRKDTFFVDTQDGHVFMLVGDATGTASSFEELPKAYFTK